MWGSLKRGDVVVGFLMVIAFGLLVGGGVTWMNEIEAIRVEHENRVIPAGSVMLEAMTQNKTTGDVIRFHIVMKERDALMLEDEFLLLVRRIPGEYSGK